MHNMVKDKTLRLASIQNRIQEMGPDNDLLKQEKDAQLDLEVALNKKEAFWLEKSRIIWHVAGEKNTSFFHRISKIKCSKTRSLQ